jgi:hypothetical protein
MENGKREIKAFMMIDDGTMPVSKEGSSFIGWMEMRLKECLAVEDYEEAEKLKRDIASARANIQIINTQQTNEKQLD